MFVTERSESDGSDQWVADGEPSSTHPLEDVLWKTSAFGFRRVGLGVDATGEFC
jgi:hypothetical protein